MYLASLNPKPDLRNLGRFHTVHSTFLDIDGHRLYCASGPSGLNDFTQNAAEAFWQPLPPIVVHSHQSAPMPHHIFMQQRCPPQSLGYGGGTCVPVIPATSR
eukprot:EG_transcript_66248